MTCSPDDGHEGVFELYKIRTLNKREKKHRLKAAVKLTVTAYNTLLVSPKILLL